MKKMKFVIVSPRQKWGGAIVLHALCKYLWDLGYDARIYYSQSHVKEESTPTFWKNHLIFILKDTAYLICGKILNFLKLSNRFYNGYVYQPVEGTKRKFTPFITRDTIVVYSEKMYGNPLKAKNVVRYLLYHTDIYEDINSYEKNDLFFIYRDVFRNDNVDGNLLKLLYFNLNLYKQTNFGERHGNCYVIRKGRNRLDLPCSFDGPIVDDLTEPEIVKVFNTCEKAFLYDMQTFYAVIAALCGCVPISVLEPGKKKSDYIGKDDPEPFGRAFGDAPEEIEYAIRTRETLRKSFENREKENIKEVEKFIKECEYHFNIQ